MKIGLQTFTMRDFMKTESDIEFTLNKAAEIGYTTVQISGIGEINPKKLRAICDACQLEIVLTHTKQDRLLSETDQVIEEHNILGADYIGIGSMPGKYRDPAFIQNFIKEYTPVAEKIADAGKLFMYHNHAFEFEKMNGKRIIDSLIEGFPAELMGFTLDTYWVQNAGCDVYAWFERLKDRVPCIHLKDMAVVNGQPVMAPIYEGNINFDPLLKMLAEHGKTKYALVEQDNCIGSPFTAIETSYKNLVARGYK